MVRTKYGYVLAIAAAAILLMVSSVNHPIIGQQIKETIADAIEGEPTWTYYNQVRANKGLTPEEAREKGSRKFDGPDEDGNDPYERCEQQVANGEYDTILEAVLAEFDRTHRPSSGEADPARLGSTLTAHEEVIKSIDQSKLSDEEKQRLNLIVMPDEHDEVVGKRPNAFMNHAERGMSGYEYAEKGYELMVENHKLATPSIEKIEDSYTSQTFQEPYSLEMGGNRPKVVVEQSVHEGGYMLVWTYPDGTREEYRINCGFQWINTQDHGWTPVEWNPPSDNPPSKPDKPDEPDEPNEEKDMSKEMQSANPGNSSVDGRKMTSRIFLSRMLLLRRIPRRVAGKTPIVLSRSLILASRISPTTMKRRKALSLALRGQTKRTAGRRLRTKVTSRARSRQLTARTGLTMARRWMTTLRRSYLAQIPVAAAPVAPTAAALTEAITDSKSATTSISTRSFEPTRLRGRCGRPF